MAWVAVTLHFWYGAAETALERLLRGIDGGLPQGSDGHRALLQRAALAIAGRRPALLSPESLSALEEVRKFRHFFRHAYAVSLDEDRLRRVAEAAVRGHEPVRADLAAVVTALRG